ncbi:MAG: DUF1844 domain-containing protein [Planctomycetaceae bacterium]|nr:DUF1844 domain-containing protein [Planctomycetaceae bacterium]
MPETPNDGPQIEIHSDEDWKDRVKAEDRLRDEQAAGKPAPTPSDSPNPYSRLPSADLSTLIQMLATQAMAALGLLAGPGEEQPVQRLPLARHFIDLLGVIDEKTRGNLTPHEEKLLSMSLHELRMTFVEMSKQSSGEHT